MSAITTAYQERPRVALLWTVAVVVLIAGAYFVVRGLDGAGGDSARVESELSRTQAELQQADAAAASAAAERDQLAAKLQARERRIRELEKRVGALNARLEQARQPTRRH